MYPADILEVSPEQLQRLPKIVPPLLDWFHANARTMPWRDNPQPYWVWISEIMLQQTRVEAVREYFNRFTQEFPTIEALAKAPEERVLKLWEGLGYYSRARNIKKTAEILLSDYNGQLPPDYDHLLTLPGIGEYTAGAIASIAFGLRVPAIDGNVYRVISRFLASYRMIDHRVAVKRAYFQIVGDIVPADTPGDFNQALMELGAMVCIPNGAPRCQQCPLREVGCAAFEETAQEELPVLPSKRPRRLEERTIVVLTSPYGTLLQQRPSKGLLANLWEPLNIQGHWSPTAVKEHLDSYGFSLCSLTPLSDSVHIFSHIEWHMRGFHGVVEASPAPEGFLWVDDFSHHSIPAAFAAYTESFQELSADEGAPQ